jgi:hypothetical protein
MEYAISVCRASLAQVRRSSPAVTPTGKPPRSRREDRLAATAEDQTGGSERLAIRK